MLNRRSCSFTTKHRWLGCADHGFSLLEILIVLAIVFIVSGIGFMALQPALKDARASSAFDDVLMQLRIARQRSITERKQYIVCFGAAAPLGAATPLGAPNTQSIQTFRWDANAALSAAIQISTNQLPTDIKFQTLPGIPNNPNKVPDGFGSGGTAIDFDQAVVGGIRDQVMFWPDGSAHDTSGNLNSGIIYVARDADLYSSRAITVYGASGRIRGWRLVSSAGAPQWLEQ
jgi:prepilin-type N-terminal cleavage/methylation domain-containing protein